MYAIYVYLHKCVCIYIYIILELLMCVQIDVTFLFKHLIVRESDEEVSFKC